MKLFLVLILIIIASIYCAHSILTYQPPSLKKGDTYCEIKESTHGFVKICHKVE